MEQSGAHWIAPIGERLIEVNHPEDCRSDVHGMGYDMATLGYLMSGYAIEIDGWRIAYDGAIQLVNTASGIVRTFRYFAYARDYLRSVGVNPDGDFTLVQGRL